MILALAGIAALIVVPSIAILTYHQRKMAEAVRNAPSQEVLPALIQELKELKDQVRSMRTELNANTIVVDTIKSEASPPTVSSSLVQRVQSE